MNAVQRDVNSHIWQRDIDAYEPLDSWTDVGERVVVNQIADQVRGKPILDVGMGTGRSSWFLRPLSDDYVGVDYTPAMVARAQALRPDVTFRLGDARDLSEYADGSFGLVFFSHAGLDSLDHSDRSRALREFARLLEAGGLLVYSTLNRDGSFYRCGPGPVALKGGKPTAYNVARFVARSALHPVTHAKGFANVHRLRSRFTDEGSWAIDTMPTHDWGLVVHYVTFDEAVHEVEACGLRVEAVITREGRPMAAGDPTAWFHVVARKPD